MELLLRLRTLYWKQRPFVRVGIPFAIFMAGGTIGLRQFVSLKYELNPAKKITPEEAARYGVKMRPPEEVSPDIIYENEVKKMDVDNWENIRGPRPWEDPENLINKMKELARERREKQKRLKQQEE